MGTLSCHRIDSIHFEALLRTTSLLHILFLLRGILELLLSVVVPIFVDTILRYLRAIERSLFALRARENAQWRYRSYLRMLSTNWSNEDKE